MTEQKGTDTEAFRRIESLRATFERLRAERIRAETEVDRLNRELEVARAEARATFGTDDEAEIERLIAEARARNLAMVAEFEAVLRSIEGQLAALDGTA